MEIDFSTGGYFITAYENIFSLTILLIQPPMKKKHICTSGLLEKTVNENSVFALAVHLSESSLKNGRFAQCKCVFTGGSRIGTINFISLACSNRNRL